MKWIKELHDDSLFPDVFLLFEGFKLLGGDGLRRHVAVGRDKHAAFALFDRVLLILFSIWNFKEKAQKKVKNQNNWNNNDNQSPEDNVLTFFKSLIWFKEQISLFLENKSKFLFSLFFSASEIQRKSSKKVKKGQKMKKIEILMIIRARKIMF